MPHLHITEVDDTWILALADDVDIARRDELEQHLLAFAGSGKANALLDVSDVDFMDTTGVTLVVRLQHIAHSRGGRVTLVGPNTAVHRVFEVCGLLEYLDEGRHPRSSRPCGHR